MWDQKFGYSSQKCMEYNQNCQNGHNHSMTNSHHLQLVVALVVVLISYLMATTPSNMPAFFE